MLNNAELQRSLFISSLIRDILEEKDITIQELSKKMDVSHPYISQNLNGKKVPSDNFLEKVMKGIPLNSKEIKEIFKKGDIKEFECKYGEHISDEKIMNQEEIEEFIIKNYNITKEELKIRQNKKLD